MMDKSFWLFIIGYGIIVFVALWIWSGLKFNGKDMGGKENVRREIKIRKSDRKK